MSDTLSSAGTIEARDRTPVAIRADNIIRQKLRIGDPRNPLEVAEGLRRMFPKDAGLLTAEAAGWAPMPARPTNGHARAPESVATGAELQQAMGHVDRDLAALTADHRLKGLTAELQGWGQAIRSIISDGAAAARLALDPRARDRLFAARRQLGDYARLARLIGALTQTLNVSYRRLARSLDQVASLLLVLAGEVLAGAGVGGGRFLLSVPASELQARRDAVLLALRNLAGTTDQAYGNDQWPWGLHGFREMLRTIEASGHLDLRALLEEPTLGRVMDELIERAAQQSMHGLRALGATAEMSLERIHRLIHLIHDKVEPEVPAVTTFLKSLQLLLDAFTASRSGYRILYLARAPIGLSGAGSFGGPDDATRRLIDLVIDHNYLGELLDCQAGDCCSEDVICQIQTDSLHYYVGRAVDLLMLASDVDTDDEPEWRAAAYGVLINRFLLDNPPAVNGAVNGSCLANGAARTGDIRLALEGIAVILGQVENLDITSAGLVRPATMSAAEEEASRLVLTDELCMQQVSCGRLGSLIATLAPGCVAPRDVIGALEAMLQSAIDQIAARTHPDGPCGEPDVAPPPTKESALRIFYQANRPRADRFGNVIATLPRT